MKPTSDHSSIDWARRVNRSWIVQRNLNEHAEVWLEHLENHSDGRLQRSSEIARAMCGIRDRLDDPKPWFYAGLFSLASASEAKQFLATHPVTKAAIPAMADDGDVQLWMDRIGPETRELIDRLRHGITRLHGQADGVG